MFDAVGHNYNYRKFSGVNRENVCIVAGVEGFSHLQAIKKRRRKIMI